MVLKDELASHFGAADYVVFVLMLCTSSGIGLYYGCSGNRQRTAGEFLMANRSMGIIPVTFSLLANFLSSLTLLGIPSETYVYGTSYSTMCLCFFIAIPISAYWYLPVFYELELTSVYEYLEKRFNSTVRKYTAVLFIIQMLMYMSLVTYAPALALNQVTGLSTWGTVAATGVVCILYTTIGGLKAVMWTDVLQCSIMLLALSTVAFQGVMRANGLANIWDTGTKGGRIDGFNLDPSPFTRHTLWNLTLGATVNWVMCYGVHQIQVQRYLSLPSLHKAQRSLLMNLPAMIFVYAICALNGLLIYAQYKSCDPLTANIIKASDQLLPLYVMDTLGGFPGLPGLFTAGIFSAALSTLSSILNSLAAITLEDFVKSFGLKDLTEEKAGLISKFLAFGYGVVTIALVALVANLDGLIQAAISIFGILGGPAIGVFTLGLFFPWANSAGALAGLTAGLSLIMWIGIGAQITQPFIPKLGISVDGCNFTDVVYNITIPQIREVLPLYKVSYQWYSAIAWGIVITMGLIVSFLTGHQNPKELDAKLLSPAVRKLAKVLPIKYRDFLQCNFKEPEGKSKDSNNARYCAVSTTKV